MKEVLNIRKFFNNKDQSYVLISQIMSAIIALVSGKIIAIYISPTDFGTYNLQFAAYTFFASLLISPFLQFIKASNNTFLPKIGSKYYLITVIIVASLAYLMFVIFVLLYYGENSNTLFAIIFLFIPISIVSSTLGDYLTTTNKLVLFSKYGILNKFSALLFLTTFFLLGLTFVNDSQVLWLMQIVGALISVIFFISNYQFFKVKAEVAYRSFLKKYFRFAGPLMFLAIWSWINNYFDRYAIEYFLSVEDVGIYNASYSVGSKFFLLISPVFMILLTPKVYDNSRTEKKKKNIKNFGMYYLIIAVPLLILIYFTREWIGQILLSENYSQGFFLIFWIALAFFLFTSTQLFELLYYSERKTKIILWGNVYSALTNLILNISLIPKYGLFGAAMATIVGFTVYLIFVRFYFYKL